MIGNRGILPTELLQYGDHMSCRLAEIAVIPTRIKKFRYILCQKSVNKIFLQEVAQYI